MKPFSILLAWNDGDPDEGTFSWVGLAHDLDDAVEKARENSIFQTQIDEGDDPENFKASDWVLDSMEGCNMWAAPELLAALKEARGPVADAVDNGDDASKPLLEMVNSAIAEAECREGGAA